MTSRGLKYQVVFRGDLYKQKNKDFSAAIQQIRRSLQMVAIYYGNGQITVSYLTIMEMFFSSWLSVSSNEVNGNKKEQQQRRKYDRKKKEMISENVVKLVIH